MSEESIFNDALAIHDPAARSAFLDSACAGDPALRRRLAALLHAHGQSGDFLEPLVAAPAAAATGAPAMGEANWGALATLTASHGPMPRVLLPDTPHGSDPSPVVQPGSPEMPDLPDRTARLQLFGEIARGGMGAVLKGRDVDLGRDLAVKVLLERHRHKPELVRRFVEEAQIAGQLQHPGVVPVYELGAFADRRPYFAMKLVKGRTLAAVLAGRAGPDEDLMGLLGTMLQVGQTVAFAHARGVIHRDLKPSNIMLGSFGEVQVMDWGLAKVLPRGGAADDAAGRTTDEETVIATARSGAGSDLSKAGSVMGTPSYMAPEQARGEVEAIDERADVFALGSILCEVLTGRPAFHGRNPGEVQRRAARGDLADAVARLDASGADAELIGLAKACLAPERDDRPRDASAFVERLGGYLSSIEQRLRTAELERAAEHARAEEAGRRVVVERQRRRYQVGLAASLLALSVAGGLAFTLWSHQRQAREARLALALKEATLLRDQAAAVPEDVARWEAAVKGLDQAERDPAEGDDPKARGQLAGLRQAVRDGLAAARRDREFVEAVARVRANKGDLGRVRADAAYARAFLEAGLDVNGRPPAEVGAALADRPPSVVAAAAAALDDWSLIRNSPAFDEPSWRRPLEVARAADRDPLRDRVRAALLEHRAEPGKAALRDLAAEPGATALPPPSAVLLGMALIKVGMAEQAVNLLRAVVIRHPDDVWLNHGLAEALMEVRPAAREEALRYYTAARARQPKTATGLAHLLDWMGRGDEALAIYADLDARSPGHASILVSYGNALKERHRPEAAGVFDRAIAALGAAIREKPDDVEAHHDLGIALKGRGRLAEAVAEYRTVLRLRPDSAEAHTGLANALGDQGKLTDAVAEYRAALRLKPDAAAHTNLGSALDRLGKLDEAVAEYRSAIRLEPHLAYAHAGLGKALDAQGKASEAATEYREAIRLAPDFAVFHANLADVLAGQGKFAEAEAETRLAIRLAPGVAWFYSNLGLSLLKLGRPDEAVAEIRKAIRLQPDRALAHSNLAAVLRDQGKLDEAEAEARAAIRLDPDDVNPHLVLGNVLKGRGKLAEAEAECRAALRLKSDDADAHLNLANTLNAQQKRDEAVAEYREAIRLRPDFLDAQVNLGVCLEALDRLDEAVAVYRSALRSRPDAAGSNDDGRAAGGRRGRAGVHNNLGLALIRLGRREEAVPELRAALRLEPNEPIGHSNLGNLLRSLGRPAEAIPELREAIRLKPDSEAAHYNLGLALRALGDFENALAELRRTRELGGPDLERQDPGFAQQLATAELQARLAPRFPAVLRGEDRPADATEAAALASMANTLGRHAAAARLWAEAFANDPKLADDLAAGHRYNAACAAALAGAGKGQDDPPPDDSAREALRHRALDWLRADLALRTRQLATNAPQARAMLRHWTRDPDLAGIRDPDARAALPEAERGAWQALWAEVGRLIEAGG